MDETTDYISAKSLSELVKDNNVRLVILSACQSGMIKGENLFNSFGPQLIRNKVPAVVAMQFTIPIGATVAFAEKFYNSLASGDSIVAAVTRGRKGMSAQYAAWFFPTVYLRIADGEGYLFSPQPQSHALQRFRKPVLPPLYFWMHLMKAFHSYS